MSKPAPKKAFDIPAVDNEKCALLKFLGLGDDDSAVIQVGTDARTKIFEAHGERYRVCHGGARQEGDIVSFNSNLWTVKRVA